MNHPEFQTDHLSHLREARALLLRIADPEDAYVALCIELFGPLVAVALLTGERTLSPEEMELARHYIELDKLTHALKQRVSRWKKRSEGSNIDQEMHFARTIGAWLCIPEDDDWPAALVGLGPKAPFALWGRGDRSKLKYLSLENSVAVVGSRDTTSYGNSATSHLAGELASRGYTIVSGGAFGIDAVAHRAALASENSPLPTVALMAGGLDRLYPKQNENILLEIISRGLVLSEVPLGFSPTRWRFLQRNRLIAGLAQSTVVVEARWRSGALNTAHHALEVGRSLFAVPGPIFSPTSEGCHKLISDGYASICTSAETIIKDSQLLHFAPETSEDSRESQLSELQMRVWDALPVQQFGSLDTLSTMVGISSRTVMVTLSQLQAFGLATTNGVGWKKEKLEAVL